MVILSFMLKVFVCLNSNLKFNRTAKSDCLGRTRKLAINVHNKETEKVGELAFLRSRGHLDHFRSRFIQSGKRHVLHFFFFSFRKQKWSKEILDGQAIEIGVNSFCCDLYGTDEIPHQDYPKDKFSSHFKFSEDFFPRKKILFTTVFFLSRHRDFCSSDIYPIFYFVFLLTRN
jgi:hypothetical protein